jgi:phage FluMu protein Com
MREAMERKGLAIKQGETRIETKCGKCGAVNKVKAASGQSRVEYVCKDCGHKQRAM